MLELQVTNRQRECAIDNKAIGFLQMDPWEFLFLTVKGSVDQWGREEREEGNVQTLEMYNELGRQGKINYMPFLDVDRSTGMVIQHEGRHRALACIDRKLAHMPVAIILRVNGHKEYYEQPFLDDPTSTKRWHKRYLGVKDVPTRFLGQFDRTTIRPNLKTWVGFYSDIETALPVTAGRAQLRPISELKK